MTTGPDDQGQELPPPASPPPGGGRGLFARNDPDQPGPPPPPQPRQDPRLQAQRGGPDDNPFLLPNERAGGLPVYGGAPTPVVPLALMVLAIVIGAALFYMSREDGESSGISPQQAASGTVLHLDGIDITEAAFRREIMTGIQKGNIPCAAFAGQSPDNVAAGLRLGAFTMTVPTGSGVAQKSGQKADDASLKQAAQIIVDSCPKGAAPAGQPQQPAGQPTAGLPGQQVPGQPVPTGTQAAPPPGGQQIPLTPRPVTSPAPAATPRP